MLKAILESKAGRVDLGSGDDQSWRDVFRLREDLLTAVFFGRIRYLSEDGERKIMSLMIGNTAGEALGAVKDVVFWPKLPLRGRNFVEPDVLVICDHAMVLIEVKPPFGGDQSANQWEAEISALLQQKNSVDAEWDVPETIHFVALGRNCIGWQVEAQRIEEKFCEDGLHVHALEWDYLNHHIAKIHDIEIGRDRAVYKDWLEAFSLFGLIERPLPFVEMLNLFGSIMDDWPLLFPRELVAPFDLPSETSIVQSWLPFLSYSQKNSLRCELWN